MTTLGRPSERRSVFKSEDEQEIPVDGGDRIGTLMAPRAVRRPSSMPPTRPTSSRALPQDPSPGFSDLWRSLVQEIEACQKCHLGRTRNRTVVYRGAAHPSVLFIGEAPGAEEDRTGLPFVGRSGARLDRAIARLGLGPEAHGILNLIKCRPPENRFDRTAAQACRPYLTRQIDLLQPILLITLGARALGALDPKAPSILRSAGSRRSWDGRPLVPLLHPAASLHDPRLRSRWERDIDSLAQDLPSLLG
ncbi:MAG TPA: uracil-DNA glycosylase [Thermoplasmata archaeon]|nr:uracil-DNA glycosylase [Thermoplasmata archaeon]